MFGARVTEAVVPGGGKSFEGRANAQRAECLENDRVLFLFRVLLRLFQHYIGEVTGNYLPNRLVRYDYQSIGWVELVIARISNLNTASVRVKIQTAGPCTICFLEVSFVRLDWN